MDYDENVTNSLLQNAEAKPEEKEIVIANLSYEINQKISGNFGKDDVPQEVKDELDRRLQDVNDELKRYTNHTNGFQYALSVAFGIIAGVMDSLLFSDVAVNNNDVKFSHKQVNLFIQKYAKFRGIDGKHLENSIGELEQLFKVPQDNVWKNKGIEVGAKNHHLADIAHHPTIMGLIASLAVQFLRVGTFVNRDGEWHFIFVETSKEDIFRIAVPAVITGILNWLAAISENKYEEETEKEIPKAIHKLAHIFTSTPELLVIVKCADNWFGHLVSDMGGSKNTAGGGMGIPGIFVSLLHEISALPILKETNLPGIVNDLYVKQKMDLRHELAHLQKYKLQAVPVIFYEIFTRLGYMILELGKELINHKGFKGVNWKSVIPFGNRSVDRCLTVSALTFSVIDTADAAVRAAVEAGGDWVIFSGKFAARYNIIGAGRAVLAVIKEVSADGKENQLLYEKMLLMNAKSEMAYHELQLFKARLEEKVSNYLAEDIETFINGFDYMKEGMASGNSNLIIKGNVVIQKVLGKEPQFTTQDQFDSLMASDTALQF